MSAHERSGWRDLALSRRHRTWGVDCPAVDVDLFLEYDGGKACGIVEYKSERARMAHSSEPSMAALLDLAQHERGQLPVFGVRYASDFSWWAVTPLNAAARSFCCERTVMTERDYVALLYWIRGRQLPTEIDLLLTKGAA